VLRMKKFGKDKNQSNKTHPEALVESDQPHQLAFAPGLSRFLQAKRACRASPPLLASRCSTATRRPRKSGKSPCRSTSKAKFNIVARLCRASASNQPSPPITRPPPHNIPGQGKSDSDAPQAPHAADCRPSQSSINKWQPQADTKADYRIRSTNPIPAYHARSTLDYKSALVFR
jgi:hypothetical protein